MSVEEYKKRTRDPTFIKWINRLYKKPPEKPFNPEDF